MWWGAPHLCAAALLREKYLVLVPHVQHAPLMRGLDCAAVRVLALRRAHRQSRAIRVGPELLRRHLALNMFCQYIYLWMYGIPAADLYRWRHLQPVPCPPVLGDDALRELLESPERSQVIRAV